MNAIALLVPLLFPLLLPQRLDDDDARERALMDPVSASLLFPRNRELEDAQFAQLQATEVRFENAQGSKLRGLWFENGDSDDVVLVCMGNTGNATWMLPYAAFLREGGFDVLLFDYQGFGPSEGVASLLSLPGDALAAWRFLTEETGRKPSQIGVLGISLGSVLALQLAAEQQPRACAVEDVFFPDRELAAGVGADAPAAAKLALAGIQAMVLPKVDPRRNSAAFGGALFLMHGDLDWLLTPMATVELAEARPKDRRAWILANTGHSPDSLQIDEWEFRDQLVGFFRDAFAAPATVGAPLLSEPAAKLEVLSKEPPRVKVTVEAAEPGPVQVTLVAAGDKDRKPLFHHERRYATAGASAFECSPAFVPEHVLVTAMVHARDRGDGTWEPELSPFSQSIVDFTDFLKETSAVGCDVDVTFSSKPGDGPTEVRTKLRSSRLWPALKKLLPDAESIDPRVRPRFAIFAARFCFDFRRGGGDAQRMDSAATEAAEAMLPFLPPDPRNFVTLGNASIDVGFENALVEDALLFLWHQRWKKGDAAGARAVFDELQKYAPEPRGR
jgi:pimeloyl-ACP methyl ester carboxylesterase